VGIEAVDGLRHAPDWVLLDSRAPERWRGEVEHLDPVAGHIPGSKNVFFKENLENGFFKKPEELREMYLGILGPVPPNCAIASCGSGLMACHTLLALHQAGLEGASLYVGSFSEWCRNRPEEIGTSG
jgi:thiosulfate/3-mercaptopyruvate sulfurtransferase